MARVRPLAALAAASLALHGCGDVGKTASPSPPAEPPPAGFAAEITSAQNAVRTDPSTVRGSPAPSPALAPFGWSASAAATAQAWADGCTYQHNAGRGQLGENIAATSPAGAYTATLVAQLWASEAPFYDYATNACAAGQQCGHYTQIVWRSTTAVGCAMRSCTVNSPFGSGSWDFWVCDYAPPGNWVGERPY